MSHSFDSAFSEQYNPRCISVPENLRSSFPPNQNLTQGSQSLQRKFALCALRMRLFFCRQIHADNLLIIARIHTSIRKCRMRPQDITTRGSIGGFQQVCATQLLVTLRREVCDNQVSLFIKQKKVGAVFYNKSVRPADRLPRSRSLKRFPHSLARVCLETTQLPITTDPVDVDILKKGRGHHCI